MVEDSIKIRSYREGDEDGITDLFNKVFNKYRAIEEWKWKFNDSPPFKNPAEWITVAERGGQIVGHYASLPVEMKYKDAVVLASQPVDTMIDPSARGETLLKLFRAHNQNKKGRDAFAFGFPNEMAYEVGKWVLGYQDLGELNQFFKRLSLRGAIRRRFPHCPAQFVEVIHWLSRTFYTIVLSLLSIKPGGRYTIEQTDTFDDRVNQLWDVVKNRFGIAMVRKSAYLNWRYKNGGYTILLVREGEEIKGYVVLKISNQGEIRVGYIIDVLSVKDATLSLLIVASRFFLEKDVDYALCGLMTGDLFEEDLKKVGFRRDEGFKPLSVVCVPLSSEIDKDYLMRHENWHLTYGDTDGF